MSLSRSSRGGREARVDDDHRLLLDVGQEGEDPAQDADLRGRQPEPVGVLEQVRQPLGELADVASIVLDLAGPHPQNRVRVLADLGERELPPRLGFGVELLVPDLAGCFGHRRIQTSGRFELWRGALPLNQRRG